MGKLVVFSVLLATIIIPLFYTRKARKRGLRKTVVAFAVFSTIWVFATLFVAPHL